jgi:hypothetical protein
VYSVAMPAQDACEAGKELVMTRQGCLLCTCTSVREHSGLHRRRESKSEAACNRVACSCVEKAV